jgi:hypothetical protein
MARHHSRASKVAMSREKVYEGLLYLRKERSKSLVEWRKQLKETQHGIGSWWTTQAYSTET